MKKIQGILAMVIVGLLAAGISGCSNILTSDDPLTPGSTNDVNYQWVEEEVFSDQIFEGIDVSFDISEFLIDSIPGASPTRRHLVPEAASEGDIVVTSWSYSYSNTWHIFQFSGYGTDNLGTDTADITGIDSIQVWVDGQAVQVPDSTMDAYNINAHFTVLSRDGFDSLTADHAVQIAEDAMNPDLIVFDAQLSEVIAFAYTDSAATATCQVNLTSSFAAVDIIMPIDSAGDCPLGGTITVTVALNMNCGGTSANPFALSVDGSWTAVGTFDGTNETFTISDGTSQWTSTEPCAGPSPARGVFGCSSAK